jgi:predicted alpha/beta-fold hydrolase
MTLYCWAKPRAFPRLPPAVPRWFDVAPDARVLAHCHWQDRPWKHPTLVALHGLEGSSEAHYMRGLADKFFAAGFNVVRLNQRTCGGTEHLSTGLYHSGLTADPRAVIAELLEVDGLEQVAVAGYSLGGNLALKLAGEYGETPPAALQAVCAVSPTIDLARCVEALEQPRNWIYQWHFVRSLKRRMRRKARLFPGRFPIERLGEVRSIRTFDEIFTAPHHGFRDAADYYARASALPVVDRIRVPTFVLSAADDPFVPPEIFQDPRLTGNPWVTVVVTPHGGHCGFVTAPRDGHDGYWAEWAILQFVTRALGGRRRASAARPTPSWPAFTPADERSPGRA